MMELAERLTELISESNEIKAIKESIHKTIYEDSPITLVTLWPDTVRRQEKLVSLLQSCVQKAMKTQKYKEEHDFLDILIPDRNSSLLNVSYWADLLGDENKRQHRYKSKQVTEEHIRFLLYTVEPPVIATAFVVVIKGNGLLPRIFMRHKETRTFQKSMLINLTVVDCFTLLTSLLLDNSSFRCFWQHGLLKCKLFCSFA
jgi:hypothetical protein